MKNLKFNCRCLFCGVLLLVISTTNAQYISNYDKNGNQRSAASKSAEEARNKQVTNSNNDRPITPSSSRSATPLPSQKPYVESEISKQIDVIFQRYKVEEVVVLKLADESLTDYRFLPALYEAHFIKEKGYHMPVFWTSFGSYKFKNIDEMNFSLSRACIYVGNYQEAIKGFRNSRLLGAKLYYKAKHKKQDWYADYLKAYHYLNYMASRCFGAMNMPDSAKKYLKYGGDGFAAEWDKLDTEGAIYRVAIGLRKPDNYKKDEPVMSSSKPAVLYVNKCVSGDCVEGTGEKTYENGDRYIGTFKDGLPDGKGTFYYAGGTVWQGGLVKGLINGEGEVRYSTGSVYKGTMVNGESSGYGKKYNNKGVLIYEGQWKNNYFNGEGKLYNYNGTLRYSGNFKDGEPAPADR